MENSSAAGGEQLGRRLSLNSGTTERGGGGGEEEEEEEEDLTHYLDLAQR